jgi:hypothetical protein
MWYITIVPTKSIINSDEPDMAFQTGRQCENVRKQYYTHEKLEKILSRLQTSPRKITGFIYTANGHDFIISKKWNRTAAFYRYNTNEAHSSTTHIIQHDSVSWPGTFIRCKVDEQISHSFCLAMKLGYVNPQNNRYWPAENQILIQKVPLHNVKFGLQCAISVYKISEPIFIETMNLQQYVTHILTPFFEHLYNCRRTYPFFQQDSVKIQTTILCFI